MVFQKAKQRELSLKALVLFVVFTLIMGGFLSLGSPLPVLAAEATYYSSASDASLWTDRTNYAVAWASLTADYINSALNLALGQVKSGDFYDIYRSTLYFDTSNIPDDAIIISATLKLYGYQDYSYTDFDIVIQNGQPTYPHDPAVVADYNLSLYSGDGGSLSTNGFTVSGYNSIELSETGLTWINPTGTTKFMLRSSRDISATTPTGTEFVYLHSSEQGTTYGPKLEIVYLSAPSVNTDAASDVAVTTASLNSTLVDDGGEACQVRWGWGETSQATITAYDNYTAFDGSYTTGQHPFLDIDSLDLETLYYFRVETQNSDSADLGGELDFTTTNGVSPPTDLKAYPSGTSVSLSWVKGAGATETMIRIKTGSYPTSETDGQLVGVTTGNTLIHSDLELGTTYYYAAWGKSGDLYSDTSATVMITTSAQDIVESDITGIEEPSGWFQSPDYTGLSGLGPIYKLVNDGADSMEMPRGTAWLLIAITLSTIAGLLTLWKTHSLAGAIIVLLLCLAFGWGIGIIPMWIPGSIIIMGAGTLLVRRQF